MKLPYKEAVGVMNFTLGVGVVRTIDVMLTWLRGTWEPGNLSTWGPGDVGPRGWERLPKNVRREQSCIDEGAVREVGGTHSIEGR